jgi:hypothetical protein
VADRGYFSSPEILACHEAGIAVTLPKPLASVKQDFVYLPEEDAYRCPAGERLPYRYTNEEDGKMLRRYGGSRVGSTSICSMLCSSALMQTHSLCANVARPSSIRSAR